MAISTINNRLRGPFLDFLFDPNSAAKKIYMELDIHSINTLRRTCKQFKEIIDTKDFWRNLLIRDFGSKVAAMVKDENYKRLYLKVSNYIIKVIKQLPRLNLFTNGAKAGSVRWHGILIPSHWESYFDELSFSEYCKCTGLCDKIKLFPRFNGEKIPFDNISFDSKKRCMWKSPGCCY